jgi:hypothetical protein|mmetsp:Transcript_39409/g.130071  ORF Transcript_39409/g.130071 Transcript_39409/m.130071 type:complete len:307 (+) Transcript_39409:45-965(+)
MSRSLQQLGEALYQRISALAKQGELDLAGKVTGMMLDAFPEPELKSLLDDSSALRERVVAAVAMLPREYQDALLPDEAPSPGGPSPTSVMGRLDGFSKEGKLPVCDLGTRWADDEAETGEESLPPLVFRSSSSEEPAESDAAEPRAAAALEEGGAVGWAVEWDAAKLAQAPPEEIVEFIAQRLQEPQVRIVRAVVAALGSDAAIALLAHTESVEAAGGMAVPETGKRRSAGGVFVKLLKDCRSFPPERQAAALLQIKTEGAAAKKEREAKRRSKAALSPPATPAAVAKGFDTLAVGDWPALGRRGV